MTADNLGQFAPHVASWRRLMASMTDDKGRWGIFDSACHDLARYVILGLDRTAAIDVLDNLATAYGLMLSDAGTVQEMMANAFGEIEEPERVPDLIEDEPRPNGNGHAGKQAKLTIPITFPFPTNGQKIPRRPWLIPGLLLRRQLTILVSPPGSGKSLLTLQLGMICSAGVDWNGWRPRGHFRALVINAEDDRDELHRRLYAARDAMGIAESDLSGVAIAENPETIVVAKADSRTKTVTRMPMLETIIETVANGRFDIVIVDPFAETFVGDENSNSELKWAGMLWREVARRTNAAVLLVHHTRKYAQDMAGDMDAGRGGGSLNGVARVVATLFTMTDSEAANLKISPENRFRYIRFDDAKANLSLMSPTARWFCKESRSLDNAGENEPADEVGVLMPWRAPDLFADMPVETANKILDEIEVGVRDENGEPTGDPYGERKSARWAGSVVQEFLQCDDKQAKKIIEKWVSNGVLEVRQQKTSSSKGKLRDCVFVSPINRPGRATYHVAL